MLLCPNVRVPCLNAGYGCPVHLTRSSQAAHLQVCPASVVCCSMEWNRWPANDAHSYPYTELHENLLKEREQAGCLDLAMAQEDQNRLFHSLKMKKLFPELVRSVGEEEEEQEREEREKQRKVALEKEAAALAAAKKAKDHIWESFSMLNGSDLKDDEVQSEPELTQEEREAIAWESGVSHELLQNYSTWEHMFSMAAGGCREAGRAAEDGRGKELAERNDLFNVEEEDTETAETCMGATASSSCKQGSSACWEPSTSSSSVAANTKREKYFYGHAGPMKIIAARAFTVPTSFSAKQGRIRNPSFYKRESRAVDTSDLGVAEHDMPIWEEVQVNIL